MCRVPDWNDGIKRSFATSEATSGVGASRHCDLAPMGSLEETVLESAALRRAASS